MAIGAWLLEYITACPTPSGKSMTAAATSRVGAAGTDRTYDSAECRKDRSWAL